MADTIFTSSGTPPNPSAIGIPAGYAAFWRSSVKQPQIRIAFLSLAERHVTSESIQSVGVACWGKRARDDQDRKNIALMFGAVGGALYGMSLGSWSMKYKYVGQLGLLAVGQEHVYLLMLGTVPIADGDGSPIPEEILSAILAGRIKPKVFRFLPTEVSSGPHGLSIRTLIRPVDTLHLPIDPIADRPKYQFSRRALKRAMDGGSFNFGKTQRIKMAVLTTATLAGMPTSAELTTHIRAILPLFSPSDLFELIIRGEWASQSAGLRKLCANDEYMEAFFGQVRHLDLGERRELFDAVRSGPSELRERTAAFLRYERRIIPKALPLVLAWLMGTVFFLACGYTLVTGQVQEMDIMGGPPDSGLVLGLIGFLMGSYLSVWLPATIWRYCSFHSGQLRKFAQTNTHDGPSGGSWALRLAASKGDAESVKALIAADADVNAEDNAGNTALMLANRAGQAESVKVLIAAGADVRAKNNNGWTPLMWAASKGDGDSVRSLIAAGADVNAKDKDGKTALSFGAGHSDIVAALKAAGAKV